MGPSLPKQVYVAAIFGRDGKPLFENTDSGPKSIQGVFYTHPQAVDRVHTFADYVRALMPDASFEGFVQTWDTETGELVSSQCVLWTMC